MWKRNYHPYNRRDLKRMVNLESLFLVCILLILYHLVIGVISIIVVIIIRHLVLKNTSRQEDKRLGTKCNNGRKWLILAEEDVCHKAFEGDGYIYITSPNDKLNASDVLYVYIEDCRQVLYKAKVLDEHNENQDSRLKLKLIDKYRGYALSDSNLKHKGFKGAGSIKLPTGEPVELLDYIEDKFLNQIYT